MSGVKDVKKMREEFSKRLTLIRKERGLSQKQAAAELGVSQALLSHYEKGIRECGLSFVVRAAQYYNVSSDFLLGLSAMSSGEIVTEQSLPDVASQGSGQGKDIVSLLGKRVVFNGIDILYDIVSKTAVRELVLALNNYLYLSVYRSFRILYGANLKNEDSFFLISTTNAPYLTDAALKEAEAAMSVACSKMGAKAPALGQSVIEADYGARAGGLLNLINNAENLIKR